MLSIICAYNDKKILDQFLLDSLKKQVNCNYELILVDNSDNKFKSASMALNFGSIKAKGDVFVYIHQDVYLIDHLALSKIEDFSLNNSFGVCGVAGVNSANEILSSVYQGRNKIIAGNKCETISEVNVLDECLFFIKKKDFDGFDYLGDTWHFYAVNYSYKCLQKDLSNYLFPVDVWHYSPGFSLNNSYFVTLKNFFKIYPNIKEVNTTMGNFKNNCFLDLFIGYYKFKINILKKFKLGIWRQEK